MIYHGEIVARSVKRAFVVVDMPFLSFQVNPDDTVRNAGDVMKKTGCKAVKLEGGVSIAGTIRRLVDSGIPVLGHVGLTPQSVHSFGGFDVRGRDDGQAIIDDALAVQEAGAFAVVLEKIPRSLAAEITGRLSIPTIGIGAGAGCDGQILVVADMLGLFRAFRPAFVRRYADLAGSTLDGVRRYIADVRSGDFPSDKESYD
jgi:3-methyl-2-oxobutanoate hydroxymethyltransferase